MFFRPDLMDETDRIEALAPSETIETMHSLSRSKGSGEKTECP